MPTTTSTPWRAAVGALALALAGGLVACTGSDSGGAPPSTRPGGSGASSTTVAAGDGTRPRTEPDATEADYVDALVENFQQAGSVFTDEGVRCLAEHWVSAIGTDTFREASITPADLTSNGSSLGALDIDRPTAETLADGFGDCGLDLRTVYLRTLEGDLSEQGKACVDDLLTEDAVRRSFVADVLGEKLDPDPLTQVDRCTR